uniref:UDP-glucuronosyltransferase 2A2-like n=1 Tax=Salarias fasciatus TaxID=181472 RepID=A0A672HEP3_SALFA
MELRFSACVLLVLCVTWGVNGGNVLVWYTEGSHWINMKPLLEKLVDGGHRVTVLVPSASLFMNSSEPSRFHYERVESSLSIEVMEKFMEEFLHFSIYEMEHMGYVQMYLRFMELFRINLKFALGNLDGVVKSEEVMMKLKRGNFDVLLADPIMPGSELVADILGIPLVYSVRFTMAHHFERYCGQVPAPPSFVPGAMSKLTDRMDFWERVWNFIFYAVQDVYFLSGTGKPTSACELMGKADIWLIRTYWDFDFPRPLLPNFKYVGGIHCKPAKPLPKDIEEFVQSSGDAGIVIFTLGSFIRNITTEKGNMIASALAQIPQKVLWKYSGQAPETLGPNTKIFNWIPQNDLLGHPKTRAFVTHGGSNGIYEAIYHGVPMDFRDFLLALPESEFLLYLNMMTMYKENAMRLSSIHHDKPLSPLDEGVFWIEFAIRNNGAKHLRVQAHELTWYQYHCLDVFAFLLALILTIVFIFIKACSFCLRKCCGRKTKTKSDKKQ